MTRRASHGPATAIIVACLLVPVIQAPGFAADAPEQTVLEESAPGLARLRNFIEDLESLRANFRQEVLDRDLELLEEAKGQVILQKPGRFRWNYTEPFERVIVADGRRVWLYEADLQQVTIRPLDASLGRTPAALLTGSVAALDNFEHLGTDTEDGVDWVRLKARDAQSDFEAIILGFEADELVHIALLDRLGQRTRIYLTEIERSPKLADDVFTFKVPKGADVIGDTNF